jgi:plasmid replication DNA-binding protein KfrA
MTLQQVAAAKAALQARRERVSQRAVLRITGGSKRDVARFLKQLTQAPPPAEPEAVAGGNPEPPSLPPESIDPVQRAAHRLEQAEQELIEARESLLECKIMLLAMQPLKVQDLLRGSLHVSDEALPEAMADVASAKQDYDRAWRQREDARADLARLHAVHVRKHQEAWVERHKPELVQARDYWHEKYLRAPSDRISAEAKKNFQEAQMQYEHTVRTAPTNGTSAEG